MMNARTRRSATGIGAIMIGLAMLAAAPAPAHASHEHEGGWDFRLTWRSCAAPPQRDPCAEAEYQRGRRAGERDGSAYGYDDARCGRCYCDTPRNCVSRASRWYIEGYHDGYRCGYALGFERGRCSGQRAPVHHGSYGHGYSQGYGHGYNYSPRWSDWRDRSSCR
jgi:hypothetical protein